VTEVKLCDPSLTRAILGALEMSFTKGAIQNYFLKFFYFNSVVCECAAELRQQLLSCGAKFLYTVDELASIAFEIVYSTDVRVSEFLPNKTRHRHLKYKNF